MGYDNWKTGGCNPGWDAEAEAEAYAAELAAERAAEEDDSDDVPVPPNPRHAPFYVNDLLEVEHAAFRAELEQFYDELNAIADAERAYETGQDDSSEAPF